jgi:hypothetical protein
MEVQVPHAAEPISSYRLVVTRPTMESRPVAAGGSRISANHHPTFYQAHARWSPKSVTS